MPASTAGRPRWTILVSEWLALRRIWWTWSTHDVDDCINETCRYCRNLHNLADRVPCMRQPIPKSTFTRCRELREYAGLRRSSKNASVISISQGKRSRSVSERRLNARSNRSGSSTSSANVRTSAERRFGSCFEQ